MLLLFNNIRIFFTNILPFFRKTEEEEEENSILSTWKIVESDEGKYILFYIVQSQNTKGKKDEEKHLFGMKNQMFDCRKHIFQFSLCFGGDEWG